MKLKGNYHNILLFEIPYWKSKNDERLLSFVLKYMHDNKIHIENKVVIFEDYYKNCLPLRKMQQIASQRGGKCTSIAIAYERNGECLSQEYQGCGISLLWKCKCKHEWLARPANIMQGQWCPKCAIKQSSRARTKYSIEDMHTIAKQKRGKCLSGVYQGCSGVLEWQCSVCKHEWEAAPSSVLAGNWCVKCTNRKRAKSKTDYDHEKILKLYGEGKNFSEISREIGCNKSTARLVCRKNENENENVRRI